MLFKQPILLPHLEIQITVRSKQRTKYITSYINMFNQEEMVA